MSSCVGEFGEEGRLFGLSSIESLHCLLPKPGLVAGFLVEAGSWTGSWTASFGPFLLLGVSSCVGEFGDDGRLLGLSNIESLHCLFPKPGLVAAFLLVEGGSWTARFGPLLIVSSCVGEFGDDDRLFGLSNIESLHCLLPKPGLVDGFLLAEGGSWTGS
jgi:hypothetical protein